MRRGGGPTSTTYYFSLFTKEGVTLHRVVAVGGDEVKDVVVGSVCGAVGDPGGRFYLH